MNLIYPFEDRKPILFSNKLYKGVMFDITECICGQSITFIILKKTIGFDFFKDGIEIEGNFLCQVKNALVNILRDYNAEQVILQVKFLEKDNYYKVNSQLLAYRLDIDGIEQTTLEMAEILRKYNIEIVPVIALKQEINEETKEKYSGQSKLSKVENKGLICTNVKKSLSFLL